MSHERCHYLNSLLKKGGDFASAQICGLNADGSFKSRFEYARPDFLQSAARVRFCAAFNSPSTGTSLDNDSKLG